MAMLTDLDNTGNTCEGSAVEAGENDQGKENPVSLCLVLYYLINQTGFSLYIRKRNLRVYVNSFSFSSN